MVRIGRRYTYYPLLESVCQSYKFQDYILHYTYLRLQVGRAQDEEKMNFERLF